MTTMLKAARYRLSGPETSPEKLLEMRLRRLGEGAEVTDAPRKRQKPNPSKAPSAMAAEVPLPKVEVEEVSPPKPARSYSAPPSVDPAPTRRANSRSLFDNPDDGFGPDPFPTAAAATGEVTPPKNLSVEAEIEAIRREGLTGRQLRLARRMAEKHNMQATSDLDAVRQLRKIGLDPFARSSVLDMVGPLVTPSPAALDQPAKGGQLANATQGVTRPTELASPVERAEAHHISDVQRIQREIARRRRRKTLLLWARLWTFVGLPTLLAYLYFAHMATPMYATRAEFVIQQAENTSAAGLGSLFSGTQFATSQDSIAVQGYLQSREAMLRLDEEVGFRDHFASEEVDPLQRLDDPTSIEAAYDIYKKYVKIAYDPTEGIVKLEVSGPDPELSAAWSKQLIAYAEEQVNQLSERLRADQMTGSLDSYAEAERKLLAAQERVVTLQEQNKVLSSQVEITLISSQVTALESQLSQDRLALAQMLSNATPNRARVDPLQRRIDTIEQEIATLRARLTEDGAGGRSIAKIQSELTVAETEVQTRQMLLTQAAQQTETARIEANRQQRYLSVSVAPVAPDKAAYPRVFENTAVALLVFLGIYLMISLTASILREQVAN